MKPYNEQEFNRLCAEFLGGKIKEDGWNFCLTDFGVKHCGYGFHEGFDLKFHSDWNWIMEVVEKIENLRGVTIETNNNWVGEFTIVIRCGGYSGTYYKSIEKPRVSHGQDFRTKKEAVVEAIWQFLNWYNEQKQ